MKKKYISKTAPFIRDWQLYSDNFNTKTQKLNIKFKLIFAITTLICLCFNEINAQSPSTFTTSGTWVCPRGVTQIQVEAHGGGGGGQNSVNTNNANAGGGGGGAYAARNNVAVVPGNTYTITIGAAGAAGAPGVASDAVFGLVTVRAAGGATGTSSFTTAGIGGIGGSIAGSLGDVGFVFAGGNGGNGTFQPTGNNSGNGGGGGGGAGSTGAGNPSSGITAGGVKLNFGGAGGAGGVSNPGTAAPTIAGNYGGGGGGGGHKDKSGGAGQPGAIIITFTCPTENAAAGLDQIVCSTTATMAGNTPTSAGLTGTWTLIAGTATITTPNSPTTGITGLGASATLRWTINNGRCGSTFDDVLITRETVPLVTLTPNPSNAATGVCYAGTSVVTSISWAATAGATSYDVYFGTAISPVTLSANVITNSYTIGALSASTTYYWRIVAKNACGNAPSSAIWSFTTATTPCVLTYCPSTYTNGPGTVDQITNVTLGTLNNSSGASVSPYYTFYNTAIQPNLTRTLSASISITLGSDPNQFAAIWIDFNQDGIFQTTEGTISANAGANGTVVITIPVPIGALLGNTRMRVRGGNDVALTTAQACGASSSSFGETEDYIVNIIDLPVCTTPTIQATSLFLMPSGTSIAGNFTAASPSPNNYLVVLNTTGVTPTPVNGTTYIVGGLVGTGNTVVDIDSNTSFVATGLNLSTTYYLFVYSYNSACTGGPLYLGTSPLNSTTTTLTTNYCIPTGNLNCNANGDYIANVTLNTLNNNTTCTSGGYTNFSATGTQTTTLTRSNTYNLSMGTGPGNKKHGAAVWIDFNQNSVFTEAGEYFFIGNGVIANSINTIAIAIPAGATLGTTRMRVRYGLQTNVASTSSCIMGGTFGETEDYTISIINPIVCEAPTTQPTAIILNGTGTTITGSFTAATPIPNNYLVVINTTGVAPTPINATNYIVGGTIGAGNIVVDVDSNTGFVISGLTALTTYYVFVFAYNSACSGGPTYNTISPLNGTITTIAANYCIPSVTSGQQSLGYFSEISFVGTLNDVSNYSTFSTTPLGYQNFTGLTNLSRQAQGEGVNISVQALNSSFMKAWVDWNKDGDFLDTGELVYNTGGISTYSTTFGFIIPPTQALGNYRIRIRCNSNDSTFPYDANSTDAFTSCGNINYGGETEDYLFTVIASCNSLITTVTDGRTCGPGPVNLAASSASVNVTQYRWYTTPIGSTLVGATSTGSWTTPSISTNFTYYVTAFNGCESLVRTAVQAIVSPIPTLTYYPTNPVVCGEDIGVELSATGDVEEVFLIDEKFTSGLGAFTNTNIISTAENTNSQWQNRTSTFVLTPITNYNVWFPAISTGVNGNNFAMSTSDVGGVTIHNQIASATLNSTSFTTLTLSLRLFYSRYYVDGMFLGLDYVTIDVSTNGGTAWTEIQRYTEDVGIGTRFETVSFNLSSYINQTNLKIRVRYYGEWCDGLAIDDIKFYGNRPSTDLNWTTAIPSFTDAACTIPYNSNNTASTIYVKPSLVQLELGTFSFLATAVLSNGCSTSQTITITNTSKIWQGGTNWETAANWKPVGVPTAINCVIIPSVSVIPGGNYLAYAKNLTVKPTGNLNIISGSSLTVTDFVNVNTAGIFNIENNGSLVQINNIANIGPISYRRTATGIKGSDYIYWSSPVSNQIFSAIYTTPTPGPKYQWNTLVNNNNGAFGNISQGNWNIDSDISMIKAKGYTMRGSSTFSSPAVNILSTFSGVPNNGDIPIDIYRGAYTGVNYIGANGATITNLSDNYNLLGNPYPSAINALQFLSDNSTVIKGNVSLWTHGTDPMTGLTNPFYGTFGYNYSPSDYTTINFTGSTISGSTDIIKSGQAFFVEMIDGLAATATVNFKNNLRRNSSNNPYSNSNFFRTNNSVPTVDFNAIERSRIWLDIVDANSLSERTLIGYVNGATLSSDHFYDAATTPNGNIDIYTLIGDENFVIQGRPLPFDSNDIVPIGFKVATAGIFKIAINTLDGLFITTNQTIYLEDTDLGIIHDLRTAPYTFTTSAGTFSSRFKLRYTNNSLGYEETIKNQTFAFISNNMFQVQSEENIKQIMLYDVAGKLIKIYQPNELSNHFKANFFFANGVYFVKITLENGIEVAKKLLH